MNKAQVNRLVRGTYEHWNGEGSWNKASSWRKADWKGMVMGIIEEAIDSTLTSHPSRRPQLPSEMPMPPQPFKPHTRPLRADALDDNPDD